MAARDIMRVCAAGLGIDEQPQVYLDIRHLTEEKKRKLESVLEIYKKFTGDDPREKPMKVFPAVHYSMGGAWVDWPAADASDRWSRYRQMTSIPGCFNCGESDYQYHGANRLGANSLLSCIFSGLVAGDEMVRYLDAVPSLEASSSIFEKEIKIVEEEKKNILSRTGPENVHRLHDEMADFMVSNVTVVRTNKDLERTLEKLKELRARFEQITVDDKGLFLNQTLQFALQFGPMIELAMVMTKSALLRNEFRGSHYKKEFPERDDANWLKTTIATYNPVLKEPDITYLPVETPYVEPEKRDYRATKKETPTLKNIPSQIILPV